jgi:hypothetical protein
MGGFRDRRLRRQPGAREASKKGRRAYHVSVLEVVDSTSEETIEQPTPQTPAATIGTYRD